MAYLEKFDKIMRRNELLLSADRIILIWHLAGGTERRESMNVSSTEVKLEQLKPNTRYDIDVVSVNRYTRSVESKVTTFTGE